MKKTILLLEDDENLNRGISMRLEKEGYHVLSAFTAFEAEELFEKNEVHLIISDINLREGSGMDFCRRIRVKSSVYIIFLTALDQETDIVAGYDIGADDYITNPLQPDDTRIKSTRAHEKSETSKPSVLKCGDIRVFLHEMKVWKNEEPLSLSKKELQLLIFFLENPQQIFQRSRLRRLYGILTVSS